MNEGIIFDYKVLIVVPYLEKNKDRANSLKKLLYKRAEYSNVEVLTILVNDSWINIHNYYSKTSVYDWYVYCPDDYYPGRGFLRIALEVAKNTGKRLIGFNDGKWHGANATAGMVHKSLIPLMYTNNDLFYKGYIHHGADPDLTEKAILINEFVYAPEALLVEIDYEKDFNKTTNKKDMELFLKRRELMFPKE